MYTYFPYRMPLNYPSMPKGFPTASNFLPGGFPGQQGMGMPGMGVSGTNPPVSQSPGMLPIEQSFVENILRLNRGKVGTFYMTYENNSEWNAKVFKGVIEAAGRDHIIISDPQTGMRILLLMVNLDYVTFAEELNYSPAFGGAPSLTTR
jgi:spore germination protein Q